IRDELARQDKGEAADTEAIHFDSCQFQEGAAYIRGQYQRVIEQLNPAAPNVFAATDEFGKLLHPVQDFSAPSNWNELLGITAPNLARSSLLVDQGLGPWRDLKPLGDPLSVVRDDILAGELPDTGLPAGWHVALALDSVIPTITTATGQVFRGLITGWN